MKRKDLKPGWFYRLSQFFQEYFGFKVIKIPLHAGFSCPNRDGTLSTKGCSFCYNPSFNPLSTFAPSIKDQLKEALPGILKKNARALAYFQTYSNTYGDVEVIKKLYMESLSLEGIIGLSVSTRPDCLDNAVLDFLQQLAEKYHIWLELGLQTAHNETLRRINRCHTVEHFVDAVERSRKRGIFICAHLIIGLPGETIKEMEDTINFVNNIGIDGLKFHHLQVVKGTALEDEYKKGLVNTYSQEDYLQVLCHLLELTNPRLILHRLVGEVREKNLLVAPRWTWSKGTFYQMLEKELVRRSTYQGAKYNYDYSLILKFSEALL